MSRERTNNVAANLGRRAYAATVGTVAGIVAMPFMVVGNALKGVADTVVDTVVTPVDSILDERYVEAPFDMVTSAAVGSVDTVASTVKTAVVSPFTVGAQVYCAIAGEDANPRTVAFVRRTSR